MRRVDMKEEFVTDRSSYEAGDRTKAKFELSDKIAWAVMAILVGLVLVIIFSEGGFQLGNSDVRFRLIDG